MGRIRLLIALLGFLAAVVPAHAQEHSIAAPNLDGDAYMKLRATPDHQVLIFKLEKSTGETTTSRTVIVGPDYVIDRSPAGHLLFDFRLRRALELAPENRTFTNTSLYGRVLTRLAFLQNNLTIASGVIAADIVDKDLGSGVRFVIEHSNGINLPDRSTYPNMPKAELDVSRTGSELTGTIGGWRILDATISGTAFPSTAHATSFRAWLIWLVQLHPQIAEAISSTGRLPSKIEINFPQELLKTLPNVHAEHTVTFRDIRSGTGRFDSIRGWSAAPPAFPPHLPDETARLMVAAANGTAPGGPRSDESYITEIRQLSGAGKHLDAVLLALHASQPYDNCSGAQRVRPICSDLGQAVQAARQDQNTRRFLTGFAAEGQGNYAQAFQIWSPLRNLPIARRDILDFVIANNIVEATKRGQSTDTTAAEFAALPQTFHRALSADPYNPSRYRDIFNYLFVAASGIEKQYFVRTHAYAVIDLALALPNGPTTTIVRRIAESYPRMAADFPLLFPSYN